MAVTTCFECEKRFTCATFLQGDHTGDTCAGYRLKLTISQIENLTEAEVQNLAEEHHLINGHEVYFADLGEYFGFSALVFRSGHHLYYANNYALHHPNTDKETLRTRYLQRLSKSLYTDDQLLTPISTYNEKESRINYLNNYYPLLCDDKISAFNIFHSDDEKKVFLNSVSGMYYAGFLGFFYTADKTFIDHYRELYKGVGEAYKKTQDSPEFWLDAFKYEMFNHEYAINYQGDYDVCSCFCKCDYGDYKTGIDYLTEAGFPDYVLKAYAEARSYVYDHSDY